MNKEERRKKIIEEIKEIRKKTSDLRIKRYALEIELDHIRGHYDLTWEEKYS